jgi:hypothetical protein
MIRQEAGSKLGTMKLLILSLIALASLTFFAPQAEAKHWSSHSHSRHYSSRSYYHRPAVRVYYSTPRYYYYPRHYYYPRYYGSYCAPRGVSFYLRF